MSDIRQIVTDISPVSNVSGFSMTVFSPNISSIDFTNVGSVAYSLNNFTTIKGAFDCRALEGTTQYLSNGTYIVFSKADTWRTRVEIYNSQHVNIQTFDNIYNNNQPEKAYLTFAVGQTSGYVDGVCCLCIVNYYNNNIEIYRPKTEINDAILPNIVPPYAWKPFEQLSGNNGQFLMNLSKIDEAIIGDGSTQTGINDASKFYFNPVTSLYNLTVNMLDDTETRIAWCGRNYLTLERQTIEQNTDIFIKVTIRMYFMSDTLIYEASPIAFNIDDSKKWYLSIIYDDEHEVATLDLIQDRGASSDPRYYYNNFALPAAQDLYEIWVWLQDNGNEQEYLTPYDTGTTDNGGDPDLPRPQDHIGKPTLPTTGGLDRGIITLYRPTPEQLTSISDFLWSDNVLDNFKKYFNNFADNILSLYSLPFKPANLPTKAFKVGKMTSEITGVEYCTVRFFEIDMGEVVLRKKWGSYLDYAPYTKIEIYLPALGLHSLDTDELMSPADMYGNMPSEQGTVLKLTYNLDILTGVVVALLSVRVKKGNTYNDEVRYQFSGKIGHDVPLTGQVFSNKISSIVQATAGLVGTIASGGLTAPITVPAAVTATVQAQKANVLRIGNISGDASAMCTEVPYITITSPNKALLENQQDFTGFPSYKYGTLQNFTGFTQVLDAHVEGISCTEEERSLILTMLKEGVLI